MTRLGADATSTSVPALRSLGATWVSRYLSDYPWKNLTPAEAQALTAAGFDLVSNWENDVGDWATGQGAAFARRAAAQHAACGGPAWAPIYFSIDEKVDPNDPRLHQYFRDINSVLGVARTGAYAQTSALRALRSLGLISLTWRSMSTFGLPEGLGNPGEFDIEQTGAFNTDYDRDVANSTYFGQWRIGQAAPLRPLQEAPMQDALYAVANAPDGTAQGIWLYADGRYIHVGSIPQRDLITSQFGIQEKPLPYAAHQVLLALTAPTAPTDTQALAAGIVTALSPIVQQAVSASVQPDYDHMAAVLEAHLAATFAAGK